MIAFYTEEDVRLPRIPRRILKRWLTEVARSHGKHVGDLCYQFCSDERILQVNREFLDHDYYTDIITFDETVGDCISGDMLISLDTVASNAQQLGVALLDELYRVIVHGLLHLVGLGDKTEVEEQRMRAAEDKALHLLRQMIGGHSQV
ncbi:MAG: rRNA maturation RNase YbeY [Porphyromonadaceae bacterium]|nr:rRNA maturation RNase YbeY [Porphyromonadaceae bacterium]